MNFVGWETYEQEIENQKIILWRNYENKWIEDAHILQKLVKKQIRVYLSHESKITIKQESTPSPDEIVLGHIDEIQFGNTTITDSTPPPFPFPTVPLLKYKWDILPPEFPEIIVISDETRELLDTISHRAPQSIQRNSRIIESLRESQDHCSQFLQYILERTSMGNLVDDWPNYDLAPELQKIEKTIEDIQAHIFMWDNLINRIDFITEFSDFNTTHWYKIAHETELYIPETNTWLDSDNLDTVDFMILGSLWENNLYAIVGIYVMNNVYSIRRLCEQLLRMTKKYPEAMIYYQYITNTYFPTLLLT